MLQFARASLQEAYLGVVCGQAGPPTQRQAVVPANWLCAELNVCCRSASHFGIPLETFENASILGLNRPPLLSGNNIYPVSICCETAAKRNLTQVV
jgi:hypothetical protein